MNRFVPSVWAAEVKEYQLVKEKHSGDILWLLDHWRYPFTEHPLAKWLMRVYK